jgi:hypothetical protein
MPESRTGSPQRRASTATAAGPARASCRAFRRSRSARWCAAVAHLRASDALDDGDLAGAVSVFATAWARRRQALAPRRRLQLHLLCGGKCRRSRWGRDQSHGGRLLCSSLVVGHRHLDGVYSVPVCRQRSEVYDRFWIHLLRLQSSRFGHIRRLLRLHFIERRRSVGSDDTAAGPDSGMLCHWRLRLLFRRSRLRRRSVHR